MASIKQSFEEIDESEATVFKKRLAKLKEYSGRGTELISLYVPKDADRSTVMGQLTEEMGQSSNIKSANTRKNVQGALRKILQFLKSNDFNIPEKGIVVFSGNISEMEGKTDIRLFTIHPIRPLKTKLYWCDSEFHLAPLEEMVQPTEIYALIVLDKREATVAVLTGKKFEIVGHFTSAVAGKTRAGGQSSVRFEHLREEAAKDFYRRVSEKVNQLLTEYENKLKGFIIGGPGMTKHEFLKQSTLDYRLKDKIIGMLDVSYTDDSGIRELIQRSEDLLSQSAITRERQIVNRFLEEAVRDGLAAYGQKQVEEALLKGQVSDLLISEGIEWMVYKVLCDKDGFAKEIIVKDPKKMDPNALKCEKCGSKTEILEEVDYMDWLVEKAHNTSSKTNVISQDTSEGQTFYRGFGGIGAILRYK
ncbi:MAG: peptide chain release factor aRF-1 [Candidatus Micrarchaeota archaeon]